MQQTEPSKFIGEWNFTIFPPQVPPQSGQGQRHYGTLRNTTIGIGNRITDLYFLVIFSNYSTWVEIYRR